VTSLFALGYLLDGSVRGARPGDLLDAFFFNVKTIATIGSGSMAAVSVPANVLFSLEALIGLVGFALVTGLTFARFSRPSARVRFSRNAVISRHDGLPCLMFRTANERENQIIEAQIHVVFVRSEFTAESRSIRRIHDLNLVRDRNALFALTWTAVHPIDRHSPLFGMTNKLLKEQQAVAGCFANRVG
jgi:inward rectifier potassium channel